jgi:hypothetical protein
MKQIPLSKGQFAIVDDDDFEWLSQWEWSAIWAEGTQSYYARRMETSCGTRLTIRMHRQILGLETGDKLQGDHINGNTLDNRRENLRAVSSAENKRNRKAHKNNKSGFKGVDLHVGKGRWRSQIYANGRCRHLGYFHDPIEAARAYNAAAKELHGEFARLNVLPDMVTEAA